MLSEMNYSINGKPCSGNEYVDLVEEVFNGTVPDIEQIKLENGEVVSLEGNEACVSIFYFRHDGTVWCPSDAIKTKEEAIALLGAFIKGDDATLSSYGVSLSSGERPEEIDLSEGGKINRRLGRLFIVFLVLGAISFVIAGITDGRGVFMLCGFLLCALATVFFMIAGIMILIDTCRYHFRSIARLKESGARYEMVVEYCLLPLSIIFIFLSAVLFPAFLTVFLVWQGFRLFGAD